MKHLVSWPLQISNKPGARKLETSVLTCSTRQPLATTTLEELSQLVRRMLWLGQVLRNCRSC